MFNYNELKPGTVFILDGEPYEVLEFSFLRMQQRKPVAQTKIRNIITGKILSRNFQHTESFQEAEIYYKKVKFLYSHRDKFTFCDIQNPSDRFELPAEIIGEKAKFFKPNSEVEVVSFQEAEIDYKKVKFLYSHKDKFIFCDIQNPSARFELPAEIIGEKTKFFKPNSEIEVMSFKDKIVNIRLPIKMDFKVVEAPPAIRGNTAQGGTKTVTVETDAQVVVPLFINEGDTIRINTQTGKYTERIEKGK